LFKTYRPTLILLFLLALTGAYLYFFTDSDVFWGGFISMAVFYGVIFFLGTYASKFKKENSGTALMLAGRNIPLWIGIFTMSATWIGGGYINGTAENTFRSGYGLMWVQAPWGYGLSLIIGGLLFARKMRHYRFKTMLDPLAQRFGKKMSALLFLPALLGEIFWTAAILTALGATFATVLGIDMRTAIIISSLIAIAYTSIGGLWAVALTDVVQLTLIFVGLALVIPFALNSVNGWENAWTIYQDDMGGFASFLPSRDVLGKHYYQWWDFMLLLVFGGIPWQVYFQRVLSTRNETMAVRLSIFAGIICIFAALPPILIGITGNAVPSWIQAGAPGRPPDASLILPYVVRYLTPPFIATIGLGTIAAAVMSSVDSSILSASSMAGWNVYKPLVKPRASNANLSKIIKRSIWIIGITATLLSLKISSVYALWFLCSDFVYCLLFPQLIAALFDKKSNQWGALAGFTVSLVLRLGGGDMTLGIPALIPYPMAESGEVIFPFRTIAMLSGLIVIFIVSRLTRKHAPPKKLEKFPVE
jgi:high affinity choline transporter 7